jgi:tRNA-dihydrouridine synthase
MIVSTPIVRNEDPTKFCKADFNIEEPVVAQIGGSNAEEVKQAVQWMTNYGTFIVIGVVTFTIHTIIL